MIRKTPAEVRKQAALIARYWANEREQTGDLEGAGVLRDIAAEISKLRLTKDATLTPDKKEPGA